MRRWMKLAALALCLGTVLAAAPKPALASAPPPPPPPPSPVYSTYEFIGTCTDCTGTGIGTLVLQGLPVGTAYVPPTLLQMGNFYSFAYQSDLLSFTETATNLQAIGGSFALNTPDGGNFYLAFADYYFQAGSLVFINGQLGNWCVSAASGNCGTPNDFGPAFLVTQVTSVPEPASLALLGAGLAGLGAMRRRRAG